jgi:hypothetical protein
MTLQTWLAWAFSPSAAPHRFASYILARQASRDLETEVAVPEFEEAMARAGFAVHHRNRYGSPYYLAAETSAKRTYDFRKFVLAEPIEHPLKEADKPDPCAAFNALPAGEQAAMLRWIKASVTLTRRTRAIGQLRYPCEMATGLNIRDEHMRGALLTAGIDTAGHRFRCCLSNEALIGFRRARRARLQENHQ